MLLEWDLPINLSKSCILSTLTAALELEPGLELNRVAQCRDLGTMVTCDFKPRLQCRAAAKKANGAWHHVRRSVVSRRANVIIPLYRSQVRPHLEQFVRSWCPYLQQDKDALETIQRRASKAVLGCRQLSYADRLTRLNLFSLERRRLRGDMIEMFKIFSGLSDLPIVELFDPSTSRTRGHRFKLAKPRARLRLRASSFSHRVVDHWNALPDELFNVTTVEGFKRGLDRAWESVFPGYS